MKGGLVISGQLFGSLRHYRNVGGDQCLIMTLIIGSTGAFVGMTTFGASAPYKDLYKHFGITPEKVAEAALAHI